MKPCRKCGSTERLKNGKCAPCRRRWYEENREKVRESFRRWYEANRGKVRERRRRWYEENREKVRELTRRWREENREKVREQARRWHAENPWRHIVRNALERHGGNITAETLALRWGFQDGRCAITGLPMELPARGGRVGPWTASLDRLDPTKGYTEDNVRLVCWAFNAAHGTWSDADVLRLAEAIVANKEKLRLSRNDCHNGDDSVQQ